MTGFEAGIKIDKKQEAVIATAKALDEYELTKL
jgi:hypothetical protein